VKLGTEISLDHLGQYAEMQTGPVKFLKGKTLQNSVQIIFWRSYSGISCADTGINFGPIYLGQKPVTCNKNAV